MATMKQLPDGRYSVQWYDGAGVRQRRRFKDKTSAQQQYDTVCGAKFLEISGISPVLGTQAKHMREMRFKEIAEPYREYLFTRTRSKSNCSFVDRLVGKWGEWRIKQMTPAQVRPWLLDMLRWPEDKRQAVSTIKKLAAYLMATFNYACECELISANPLQYLINERLRKEFKRVNKRTKVLSFDEFQKMIEGFPAWIKRPCICAWFTGMRQGEIFDLRWKNVDIIERLFKLQAKDTKEADIRTIGIEQELVETLIEMQTEQGAIDMQDYVFKSSSGSSRIERVYFDKQFRKYADNAGFNDVHFHDMRHSYTVRKRREGHDRSIIMAQTGHHTEHMFHWYDRVDEDEIQKMAGHSRQSCEAIEAEVEKLVSVAREKNIALGIVQAMIARTWRVKV